VGAMAAREVKSIRLPAQPGEGQGGHPQPLSGPRERPERLFPAFNDAIRCSQTCPSYL